MDRTELDELHYITPICNLASICEEGILSHNKAASVNHSSVALQIVQNKRHTVLVPPGIPLHDFANLYICARNPMLYKRKNEHKALCVLRVSTEVLDLPGVVVSTGNAASNYVRFAAAPSGLDLVDREMTFARSWNDNDYYAKCRKSVAKCAEVLVPHSIDREFIIGAYVSCDEALILVNSLGTELDVKIDRDLFFL